MRKLLEFLGLGFILGYAVAKAVNNKGQDISLVTLKCDECDGAIKGTPHQYSNGTYCHYCIGKYDHTDY